MGALSEREFMETEVISKLFLSCQEKKLTHNFY